jgi:hypothetical protein
MSHAQDCMSIAGSAARERQSNCLWNRSLRLTDIVSCQAFNTWRRFSSRLLTRWNQAEPELKSAHTIPRWKIRKNWRAIQNKTANSYLIEITI